MKLYKVQDKEIKSGMALIAEYIPHGSVFKMGDRVRVKRDEDSGQNYIEYKSVFGGMRKLFATVTKFSIMITKEEDFL